METVDNFSFDVTVNDSSQAPAHTRFDQHIEAPMHMPGDEQWKTVEILLFLASAVCIISAAAVAVAG